MADRRRIVAVNGGKVVTLLDLEDNLNFFAVAGTFNVVPGRRKPVMANKARRYAGGRTVAESHDNGTISWTAYVRGTTADNAVGNAENLLSLLESTRNDLFFEWRPEGATRSTLFDIQGPAEWTPSYNWLEFSGTKSLKMDVAIPVAPLAQGLPYDIYDDFSQDTTADYTITGGTQNFAIGNGQLSCMTTPALHSFMHTGRGYKYGDVQATIKVIPNTSASQLTGVYLGALDPSNFIMAIAGSTLIMQKYVNGGNVNVGGSGGSPTITAGTPYWVRARKEGAVFTAEFWVLEPTPMGTPANTVSYTMTAAEAATYATGYVGFNWQNRDVLDVVDSFVVEPLTYTNKNLPEVFSLQGLDSTPPTQTNWIQNPSFEVDTLTWGVYLNGPTGTLTRVQHPQAVQKGNWVAKLTVTSATAGDIGAVTSPSGFIKVNPGEVWTLNAYVTSAIGNARSAGMITAFYRSDASTFVSSSGGTSVTTGVNGTWKRVPDYTVTVPAGCFYMAVYTAFTSVANGDIHYVDGVMAVKDSAAQAYFDGDTLNYRWLGTPHASASTSNLVLGDAPAAADITVTPAGGTFAPVFAMLSWAPRPAPYNWCWNGDFEGGSTDGWSTLGTSLYGSASTSVTPAGSNNLAKFGSAFMRLVTTATNFSQCHFNLNRRVKKGVTYTVSGWVRGVTTGESIELLAGSAGTTDLGLATVVLTGNWQYLSATWTPTADRDDPQIVFRIDDATPIVTTFDIDGVMFYEGIVRPSIGRHAEGAGAVPPFGIIEAESGAPLYNVNWANALSGAARGGAGMYDGTVSGAEAYQSAFWVDPHLMVADDFTLGEIDVEVFARLLSVHAGNVSPTYFLAALAIPSSGSTGASTQRYSNEYGSSGRVITKPSSAGASRVVRLGTLTLPVDINNPARWVLIVSASTATGSTGDFGLDYIMMNLSRSRAISPTGKPNDSTYPVFVLNTTAEISKTTRSDLSGLQGKPPFAMSPSSGLGGSLIEFPPGPIDLMVKLSNLVPDDPTINTTSEQLVHPATVHVAYTPRYWIGRGS